MVNVLGARGTSLGWCRKEAGEGAKFYSVSNFGSLDMHYVER